MATPHLLEALIVGNILRRYQEAGGDHAFVVTPHHSQRKQVNTILNQFEIKINVLVNTVEKMQGRESDLVIVCYGYLDQEVINQESDFVFHRYEKKMFFFTLSDLKNSKKSTLLYKFFILKRTARIFSTQSIKTSHVQRFAFVNFKFSLSPLSQILLDFYSV